MYLYECKGIKNIKEYLFSMNGNVSPEFSILRFKSSQKEAFLSCTKGRREIEIREDILKEIICAITNQEITRF